MYHPGKIVPVYINRESRKVQYFFYYSWQVLKKLADLLLYGQCAMLTHPWCPALFFLGAKATTSIKHFLFLVMHGEQFSDVSLIICFIIFGSTQHPTAMKLWTTEPMLHKQVWNLRKNGWNKKSDHLETCCLQSIISVHKVLCNGGGAKFGKYDSKQNSMQCNWKYMYV